MLRIPTPFPATGCLCFRAFTAQPARVLRHNDDGTVLLELHRRGPDGTTTPVLGSAGNITVPRTEIFEDPVIANHGSLAAAMRAAGLRAAGGAQVAAGDSAKGNKL